MLYVGLDLSRQRLDVHVLDEEGRTVEVLAVHPDADALRTLAGKVLRHGQEVSAVIERDRVDGRMSARVSESRHPRHRAAVSWSRERGRALHPALSDARDLVLRTTWTAVACDYSYRPGQTPPIGEPVKPRRVPAVDHRPSCQ